MSKRGASPDLELADFNGCVDKENKGPLGENSEKLEVVDDISKVKVVEQDSLNPKKRRIEEDEVEFAEDKVIKNEEIKIEMEIIHVEDAKPLVVLDGPSVGRTVKHQYLTIEEKFSKTLKYFKDKGHKVVIFFPKKMLKKIKNVSEEVKECLKLTVKDSVVNYSNVWGLDRFVIFNYWFCCSSDQSCHLAQII